MDAGACPSRLQVQNVEPPDLPLVCVWHRRVSAAFCAPTLCPLNQPLRPGTPLALLALLATPGQSVLRRSSRRSHVGCCLKPQLPRILHSPPLPPGSSHRLATTTACAIPGFAASGPPLPLPKTTRGYGSESRHLGMIACASWHGC